MAINIKWKNDLQIADELNVSTTRSIEVEAYSSISIDIIGVGDGDGDEGKEVVLQPGEDLGVQLLAIFSDRYNAALTYKINSDAEETPSFALEQPLVLLGEAAISLLGDTPTKLYFTNTMSEDAKINILVGRDATPE